MRALYERACAALAPIVDGSDLAAARKAADFAFKIYSDGSAYPQAVHERAYRRFGAPKP